MDECHATGFFGKTGRGTEEYFGLEGKVDIINSTLGKALGGAAGGYTAARKEIVQLLRQRSRPYLFSNSLPPAVVAAASQVIKESEMDNLRRNLDCRKREQQFAASSRTLKCSGKGKGKVVKSFLELICLH